MNLFSNNALTRSTIWIVCAKELRELVRDTRTLLMTLVLAPIMTPIFIIGIGALVQSRTQSQNEKPLEVPIVGAQYAPNLVGFLASQGIVGKKVDGDLDTAIRDQDEDLYLRIDADFAKDWQAGKPAQVQIVSDTTRQDTRIPVQRVETVLGAYAQQVGALRLLARGISPGVAMPLAIADKDLSTPEAKRGMALSFLPYLLLLSAFLGGAHLVIDATAGERERQSLEPLLATPASRSGVVTGKIFAASLLGLCGLLLTLVALSVGAMLVPSIGKQMQVGGQAIATMLLILVPVLLFGTSLLTWLAAGAKTVKQAQSYMSLLILVPMLPTLILMVNPVKTQLWQFAVPFLAQNQMLLRIIRGEAVAPVEWTVYFACSLLLALALWWLASRRYHDEQLAVSS